MRFAPTLASCALPFLLCGCVASGGTWFEPAATELEAVPTTTEIEPAEEEVDRGDVARVELKGSGTVVLKRRRKCGPTSDW